MAENNVMERDIEYKLTKMVRNHGGLCLKWVCPGWSGVPDRIILLPGGRVVFAEIKRPRGGRLSLLQRTWAEKLTALGFSHWVIWNDGDLEQFKEAELCKTTY